LIRLINYGYENGYMYISQRQGVITCLPAESKWKFYFKKWRHASLLNVDYKICFSNIAQLIKKP